jgi:hypothetical protein
MSPLNEKSTRLSGLLTCKSIRVTIPLRGTRAVARSTINDGITVNPYVYKTVLTELDAKTHTAPS